MGNREGLDDAGYKAALRAWEADESARLVLSGGSECDAQASLRRSDYSTTVFSGDANAWIGYLARGADRYEAGLGVKVYRQSEPNVLAFEAENEDSEWLAELLREGVALTQRRLEGKLHARRLLGQVLQENSATTPELSIRLSSLLPTIGTLEVAHPDAFPQPEVRLVLSSQVVHRARQALREGAGLSWEQRLGLCWPLMLRLLSQLAYPILPRDRFIAKIESFARITYLALNVLYEGRKSGTLLPCFVGSTYEAIIAAASGIPRAQLGERHPYFRLLGRLGFMLRDTPYESYADEAQIAVREYLDESYLRLSLSGAMPGVPAAMQAMAFTRKGDKIKTPSPEVGRYGIIDDEDRAAWKKVTGPFEELGFTLLRQTGIGEFGRVYEAYNRYNPQFPQRVALKVDRIIGKKKHAILESEIAMRVGGELARAPHVVRLYDTGKLPGERFTYHVLQLIEGDTLDGLVGAIGQEHRSFTLPPRAWNSVQEAEDEYRKALLARQSQRPREKRLSMPFRFALSPTMILDLLTSVLLTIEDVHRVGYAINDLKNDNIMMNRRGLLKGIDLDSFAPVRNSLDKTTDFMFLGASLILILFNAPTTRRNGPLPWEELTQSEERLRAELQITWPFGDVAEHSGGRVSREELTDLMVDLVMRSRQLTYARNPELFSADIGRLIRVKRRVLVEEMVID